MMSASSSLNPALFHGSASALNIGDIVTPQSPDGKAYATPHLDDARRYASNAPVTQMRDTDRWGRPQEGPVQGTLFGTVYEVSPVGTTSNDENSREVSSSEGFRVDGIKEFVPGNFNWEPKVLKTGA